MTPGPKTALITGAAGGLGLALVSAFIESGYAVAAGYHRNSGALQEGDRCLPIRLDVTQREEVSGAMKQIIERFQKIDLLVNNAGMTDDSPIWEMSEENWTRVLEVNLRGAFLCTQAVVRGMLQQRSGHIINIGSFSGRAGQKGQSSYAAAKAALIGLTQSIAREAGPRNVKANIILPGVLRTPLTARLTADTMETFARQNALGRTNDLGEVARFAVHLAGMENVSGQIFQLDSRIAAWT